jgi:hypothetical protein
MISRAIAQVLVGDGRVLAQSDDFDPECQPDVEHVIDAFELPAGMSAPDSLFAIPIARRHVAVVSVSGRRFRFLVLSRRLYNVIPDPFAITDHFPPNWEATGTLPAIEWPEELLLRRTVAQLDAIFKHGDGPFLLGACQTLVDSGRIALQRDQPEARLFHDLWALLPDSTRRQTWPATFAYSTRLGFGLVVLPSIPAGGIPAYLNEEQTRDYPESRYERELQVAVEHNDQRTIDRLMARRSSAETLRLALFIVLGAVVLSVATRILMAI